MSHMYVAKITCKSKALIQENDPLSSSNRFHVLDVFYTFIKTRWERILFDLKIVPISTIYSYEQNQIM